MSAKIDFLSRLPNDVSYIILDSLEGKDLRAVSGVSKDWKERSNNHICQKINNYMKFFISYQGDDGDITILKEKNFKLKKEKFIDRIGWTNPCIIREILKTKDPFFNECYKIWESTQSASFDFLSNISDEYANRELKELKESLNPMQVKKAVHNTNR